MHCTIHCLVSGEDELPPLRERISEAGIADEDVYIIWRYGHRAIPARCGKEEVDPAWSALGEFFVPAAWWWGMATGAWCGPHACTIPEGGQTGQVTGIGRAYRGRLCESGPE